MIGWLRRKKDGSEKTPRVRRWWRWSVRILAALLILVVLLRVAIHIAIPYVAEAICQSIGIRVEFSAIRLTLLSLRVELIDVALYASDAPETDPPLLRVERGDVQFDLGALLDDGTIRFPWAELDGVDLRFEIEPDRLITLWDRIGEYGSRAAAATTPEEEDDSEPVLSPLPEKRLDLSMPVEIGSVRIQHLRLQFADRRPGLELETTVLCNLHGKDLGSRKDRNRLQVTAASPNLIEALRLDLDGIAGPGILKANVSIHVAELEPDAIKGHLRQLGVWPDAKDVALELKMAVDLEPRDDGAPGASGSVILQELKLFMDSEPSFDVGRLEAHVDTWSSGRIHADRVELTGLRSRAGVGQGGEVAIAGVSLLTSSKPEGKVVKDSPPSPSPVGRSGMEVLFDRIQIRDLQVALRDEPMGVDQGVTIQDFSVLGLSFGDVQRPPRVKLEASLGLPGSVESWELSGAFEPLGNVNQLQLRSRMSGLTLARLSPYLLAAGLKPELAQGELSFSAKFRSEKFSGGGRRVDLSLDDLKLKDGPDLLVLDKFQAKNWSTEARSEGQSLELVELSGLGLEILRDPEDQLHLLGMQLLSDPGARQPSPETGGTMAATAAQSAGKTPPDDAEQSRFALERLLAHNSWVHVRDRSKHARLKEIHGVWSTDIHHVLLGPGRKDAPPMEFDLRLSIREILDRLELKGQLARRADGHDLTMTLDGEGIQGKNLSPFLESTGVSPEFETGSISLKLEASGIGRSGFMPSSIRAEDVRFHDANRPLFELSSLQIEGLSSVESEMQIDAVHIAGLSLKIERDEKGALHVAGVRLDSARVAEGGSVRPEASTDGSAPSKENGVKADPATEVADSKPKERVVAARAIAEQKDRGGAVNGQPDTSSFLLKSLDLKKFRLEFRDRFRGVKPLIPVVIDLKASDLSLDAAGPSVNLDLSLSVRENIELLRIHGGLSQKRGLDVRLGLEARGIRKGDLASYLPEGISLGLEDGRLEGKVEVRASNNGDKGEQVSASLEGWRLSDGDENLWHLDRFNFEASRNKEESEVYRIQELTTKGHEIWIRRDEDKNLRGLGLVFQLPQENEEDAGTKDLESEEERLAAKRRQRLARARALRLPMERLSAVYLGNLSVGLDAIHFEDQSHPESKAVVGHLRIRNPKPMDVVPSEFEDLPPAVLQIEASLQPIFKSLKLEITAQPWDIMPELALSLRVEGIRGEGLTEVFPELLEKVHGQALPDGILKVDTRLTLQLRRSSRTQFPLENGFGLNFELEGLELRDKPQGRVLVGLDSLDIQMRRFDPITGNLWIRSINVDTPRARIDRTEEGLILGGICLRMPKSEYAEGEETAKVETVTSSALQGQESVKKVSSLDPVMRIDNISASGVDVEYKDLRASPPTVFPIAGLEVEVKDLVRGPSSHAVPTTFQINIDGGLINLPKRPESKGLIRGLVGTASEVVGSFPSSIPMEKRPVFDELSIKGSLKLKPPMTGQVKLDLTSMELLTFQSLTKRFGVVIGDGVLDLSGTTMIADRKIEVSVYPVFTFLSLSEPKDGFLSDFLALPAPLDTTLFLTKNSYGEHVYPFTFTLKQGAISPHQVRVIIVNALSRSLATMVTNSPFRLLGGVTSIVGININQRSSVVGEPVRLSYDPGQVRLTEQQKKKIQILVIALKEDANIALRVSQRSGVEDWEYAERIGNPPKAECRAMAKGLLQKRKELAQKRSRLAQRLLSLYQNGRVEDAKKWGADLRRLDQELGELEISLEALFDHLRPGADRQKGRRTKVANQELAQRRIENVVKELVRLGGDGFKSRMETIRPRSRKDESLQKGEVILVQRRRVGR